MDSESQSNTVSDGSVGSDEALSTYMRRPWLSHYGPTVPTAVALPDQPLTWLLDEAARKYGAGIAIEYYGARFSYLQLASLAERFARALAQLGVKRGDRVSICLPNTPQFPIAFFGALKAGAVVVPTNPLYTPPELEHQLNDAGVTVIVMLDQFYPALASVRDRTPLKHVILTNVSDYFPTPLALAYKASEFLKQRGKQARRCEGAAGATGQPYLQRASWPSAWPPGIRGLCAAGASGAR